MEMDLPLVMVWLCSLDLGKLLNLKRAVEKILTSGLAEAALLYDSSGKPHMKPESVESQRSGVLRLMSREDMRLFLEEYRKRCRFARLKLRGFKVTLPEIEIKKTLNVDVYLMLHRTGFAVLSFWLYLDRIPSLEKLIKLENPFRPIYVRGLWSGLIEHLKINRVIKEENREVEALGKGFFVLTIEKIRNIYWSFIFSKLQNGQSPRSLEAKVRYPFLGIYRVVALIGIEGLLEHYVKEHEKVLHGIISMEDFWDSVRKPWIEESLSVNLAWREGWGVYIGSAGALMIITKEAMELIRDLLRAKLEHEIPHIVLGWSERGPFAATLDRKKVSEKLVERVWKDQQISIILDLFVVVELLCLQSIMLRAYEYILSEKMPKSIRRLAQVKRELLEVIEEVLNVRVWQPRTAAVWVEHGKKVIGIDVLYSSVKEKLSILESRLRTLYDHALNTLMLALTLFLGIPQVIELLLRFGISSVVWLSLVVVIFVMMVIAIAYYAKIL
ncbi:MAG: hypothetical protein DRN04_11650 [Thermoprotei archaeon]|nr:MAG: hypothetical protein DRN04_11650 [Thermoprotei archaeon]